jgi:hypothetical protein
VICEDVVPLLERRPLLLLVLVFIYSVTVPADPGALTSGMSASAVPE